jgi:cyclophilin family peptidyl-prolyl cis-trans isomerase
MTRKKRIQKKQSFRTGLGARNIQIAAIAVFAVILLVIVWIAISPRNANPTTLTGPGNAPTSALKQYDALPPMTIDASKRYLATFTMANGGQFVAELYPDKAPITVNSFVFLAREKYFDGTTFHRVLPGFMAQGGDPAGTGGGGPGYRFVNEDSDLTFDKAGILAMANAGRDTNGSQFFITFAPQPMLDGGYTIFGQVIEGLDVVLNIRLRDPQTFPDYEGDRIESIVITEE